VSNQDDSSDLSNSLLRRLLGQDQEAHAPDEEPPEPQTGSLPPDAVVSPVPGHMTSEEPDAAREALPVSPIRPTVPDDTRPQPPLTPSPPDKTPRKPLTPREQMQRAEEALINLRQKMAGIAAEFAQGKLNQAQFDAIYGRYSEQRDITERLLARNPESQAWQSVVRPGHTQFLKQHYTARVLSYAIHDQETFGPIVMTGSIRIARAQVEAVLSRLQAVTEERGNPGPALKKLGDGRCVLFMPGSMTVAIAIFSLEPSRTQIGRIEDIHRDFERANQHALRARDYTTSRMVFPHRALFEEQRY
jgi:hypothetical protein